MHIICHYFIEHEKIHFHAKSLLLRQLTSKPLVLVLWLPYETQTNKS